MTTALAIAGRLDFNPEVDSLEDVDGNRIMLDPPAGDVFPLRGFAVEDKKMIKPTEGEVSVLINPKSSRLQRLRPFEPWDGEELKDMPVLIKTQGKCTTDHISMAGPWLKYRGHLENISGNLLMGATNAFNGKVNCVVSQLNGQEVKVSEAAKAYKEAGVYSVIVAEDNYGEGSSREHAAMEPRFLNVRLVLAKSFARIHETNLKKQGMLALTFVNPNDYDKIAQEDRISLTGLKTFSPGKNLQVVVSHADGSTDAFELAHSYNKIQIEWFKAGSALNYMSLKNK